MNERDFEQAVCGLCFRTGDSTGESAEGNRHFEPTTVVASEARRNDLEGEVANLKAENAAVRELLRRMEEQQKTLLEQVERLQRRLDGGTTAEALPGVQRPEAPQAAETAVPIPPDAPAPSNTSLHNSDGVATFSTGAFAPGVTVEKALYRMWAMDGGLKWNGIAINGQYYFRWLNDFEADGPLPLASTFDHGFELSAGQFVIPKKLSCTHAVCGLRTFSRLA